MLLTNFFKNKGFTLLEVLVVIAIISLLASVIAINSSQSNAQARDEKRQADLRALQSAIEMYRNSDPDKKYPAACDSRSGAWAGQQGTTYACSGGNNEYIVGLAPEFISVLPKDPKLNGSDSGYAYMVNSSRTVYKLIAMNTVESETVTYNHPLKSCDILPGSGGDYPGTTVNQVDQGGWCSQVHSTVYNGSGAPRIPFCVMSMHGGDGRFDKSYAVWGGFEPLVTGPTVSALCQSSSVLCASEVRDTAKVICK